MKNLLTAAMTEQETQTFTATCSQRHNAFDTVT